MNDAVVKQGKVFAEKMMNGTSSPRGTENTPTAAGLIEQLHQATGKPLQLINQYFKLQQR